MLIVKEKFVISYSFISSILIARNIFHKDIPIQVFWAIQLFNFLGFWRKITDSIFSATFSS